MADIDFEVTRLNRIFKLYAKSVDDNCIHPYRLSRIEKYLEDLLLKISYSFQIINLDSQNLHLYFIELDQKLNALLNKKELAVKIKNYEEAAMLKYQENLLIRNYLHRIGIPSNVFFFHYENRVFKV